MRILRTPENSRIKGVAPVWLKFKNFHGLGREKMGSVSLAPLHGSTGAAVHINQPRGISTSINTQENKNRRVSGARANSRS